MSQHVYPNPTGPSPSDARGPVYSYPTEESSYKGFSGLTLAILGALLLLAVVIPVLFWALT
jgi:hypothetical protein